MGRSSNPMRASSGTSVVALLAAVCLLAAAALEVSKPAGVEVANVGEEDVTALVQSFLEEDEVSVKSYSSGSATSSYSSGGASATAMSANGTAPAGVTGPPEPFLPEPWGPTDTVTSPCYEMAKTDPLGSIDCEHKQSEEAKVAIVAMWNASGGAAADMNVTHDEQGNELVPTATVLTDEQLQDAKRYRMRERD